MGLSKRFLLGIVKICLITFFFAFDQNSGFKLEGSISGMPDNTTVYLILDRDTIAQSVSRNSKISFSGSVSGGTNYYFLRSNKTNKTSNALWLENENMVLTGRLDSFTELKLSGSTSHDEYTYVQGIQGENKQDVLLRFIDSHPKSFYVPFLLTKMITADNLDQIKRLYLQLSNNAKYSTYGKVLKDMIGTRDVYREFFTRGPVGTVIPNFRLRSEQDSIIKVHDIISRNEFTLLDYWASWCSPCRAALPGIKSVYDEFHRDGFGIIGISTDKNSSKWAQAVREDETPWIQMIDNVDNSSKNYLGMVAIPGYIIVDKTGRVLYADYISRASGGNFGTARLSPRDSLHKVVRSLVRGSQFAFHK